MLTENNIILTQKRLDKLDDKCYLTLKEQAIQINELEDTLAVIEQFSENIIENNKDFFNEAT